MVKAWHWREDYSECGDMRSVEWNETMENAASEKPLSLKRFTNGDMARCDDIYSELIDCGCIISMTSSANEMHQCHILYTERSKHTQTVRTLYTHACASQRSETAEIANRKHIEKEWAEKKQCWPSYGEIDRCKNVLNFIQTLYFYMEITHFRRIECNFHTTIAFLSVSYPVSFSLLRSARP